MEVRYVTDGQHVRTSLVLEAAASLPGIVLKLVIEAASSGLSAVFFWMAPLSWEMMLLELLLTQIPDLEVHQ